MKRAALASAFVGLAVGVLMFVLPGFQTSPAWGPANAYWPPRPGWIVNWSAFEEYGAGGVNLHPGQERILMVVPGDRWLVLTYLDNPCLDGALIERLAGVETVKCYSLSANSTVALGPFSGTGYTFRPGSEVVIRNMHPTYDRLLSKDMDFTGYYSR